MKTTDEIIKDCFKKASFTGDRAAYLYKLLSDEMNLNFTKRKAQIEEDALADIVINDGYSLGFNEYTIDSCGNSYEYNGNKQFVVQHPYKKDRRFNTIKGARKFIENQ
jgi:hypothetical protein